MFGVSKQNLAASARDFTPQVDELRVNLDQICSAPECVGAGNMVCSEQVLNQLMGISYLDLIALRLADKSRLMSNFATHLCGTSRSAGAASSDWFGAIAGARASALMISTQNYHFGVLNNLVNLEYFLQLILGQDYRDFIRQVFASKNDQADHVLHLLGGIKPGDLTGFDLGGSAYLPAGAGAGAGSGAGAGGGLYDFDYHDMSFGRTLDNLGSDRPFNRVNLQDNPMIGKYFGGAGYAMATMNVAIKNNLISPDLLRSIPQNIRDLTADCVVDFYTEILTWNQYTGSLLDGNPMGFNAKNREFNLTFHGTMMSWFADKYPDYNFKTQSINENLLIGIFDFNGISHVLALGDNRLESQPVNPHDGHFSPDNTKFVVAPDRNLVTFWSVAKSDEKRRAIVTYHILINGDLYQDQAGAIEQACRPTNNLNQFMSQIRQVADFHPFPGADGEAWRVGVDFLARLYRAYI